MTRSDFAWVHFDHTFTPGDSEERTFNVDGVPIPANLPGAAPNARAEGYVLVQALDVENPGLAVSNHRIQINAVDLPSFDLPVEGCTWQTWMDRIPPGTLQPGPNRIRIIHGAGDPDGFNVANVTVHWRERD